MRQANRATIGGLIAAPFRFVGRGLRRLFRADFLSDVRHSTAWLNDVILGSPVTAGVTVTTDTALTLPAYIAAIRIVSQTGGHLPVSVHEHAIPRGRRKLPNHPITRLLRNPNSWMTGPNFWETHIAHALAWGNGYALIERNEGTGAPEALWPLHPSRVEPVIREGDLYYVYQPDSDSDNATKPRIFLRDDILHTHGLGPDGVRGWSMIRLGAQAIGVGLAQQQFMGAFFGNNASLGLVFEHPGTMGDEAQLNFLRSVGQAHSGPGNAFKSYIMEEGMKAHPLSLPAKDAQMIETGMFSVIQICRLFGVPPHKVAALERATFSNIEHQAIEFVQDGILPWVRRIEAECNRKLFGSADRDGRKGSKFVRFNVNGLLRGDSATQTNNYNSSILAGWRTRNEVRALEDMTLIPKDQGGDEFFIQSGTVPVSTLLNPPEPPPAPFGAPPPARDEGDEEEKDKGKAPPPRGRSADLRPVLVHAARRLARREERALKRAAKSHAGDAVGFSNWATAFYSGDGAHASTIREDFAPVLGAMYGSDDGLLEYVRSWTRAARARVVGNFKNNAPNDMDVGEVAERMADDIMALAEEAVHVA